MIEFVERNGVEYVRIDVDVFLSMYEQLLMYGSEHQKMLGENLIDAYFEFSHIKRKRIRQKKQKEIILLIHRHIQQLEAGFPFLNTQR